jgi:hypothetical protein
VGEDRPAAINREGRHLLGRMGRFLILLTEFIYRLDVGGDPVSYIPNRDALMVTGKRNTAGCGLS